MRLSQSGFDGDPAARARIGSGSRFGLSALLAAGLITASAFPAGAVEIAPLKVGNWTGGAYTNNDTGAFSHCAVSADYRSGVLLLFSVTRDLQWSMGFSKSS